MHLLGLLIPFMEQRLDVPRSPPPAATCTRGPPTAPPDTSGCERAGAAPAPERLFQVAGGLPENRPLTGKLNSRAGVARGFKKEPYDESGGRRADPHQGRDPRHKDVRTVAGYVRCANLFKGHAGASFL